MSDTLLTFIGPLIAIIGIPFLLYSTRIHKDLEEKTVKIQTSLLGKIMEVKDLIVESENQKKDKDKPENQEKTYNEFISFMRNSKFLVYLKIHEDMIKYPEKIEDSFRKFSLCTFLMIIPLVILNISTDLLAVVLSIGLAYIISLPIIGSIVNLIHCSNQINENYKIYVVDEMSFGGYDL